MLGLRVVITGASRGVGYESSKLLVAAGAEVLGIARDRARLDQSVAELSSLGSFEGLALDVTSRGAAKAIASRVAKKWGALDVLVNNAGVQTWTPNYLEEDTALMKRDFDVNFFAPHYLAKALIPLLLDGRAPRLINVSSGAGQRAVVDESPDMPAYRISKMALNALTIAQAHSLAGKVAVNSLDPGWLKTDLGGPEAPGQPEDGGQRMMELLNLPFDVSGKFFRGRVEIPF